MVMKIIQKEKAAHSELGAAKDRFRKQSQHWRVRTSQKN
jgi:hypothetical protein